MMRGLLWVLFLFFLTASALPAGNSPFVILGMTLGLDRGRGLLGVEPDEGLLWDSIRKTFREGYLPKLSYYSKLGLRVVPALHSTIPVPKGGLTEVGLTFTKDFGPGMYGLSADSEEWKWRAGHYRVTWRFRGPFIVKKVWKRFFGGIAQGCAFEKHLFTIRGSKAYESIVEQQFPEEVGESRPVPEELRREFEERGISLPQDAQVKKLRPGMYLVGDCYRVYTEPGWVYEISVYIDPIRMLRSAPRIREETYEIDLSGVHSLFDPSNPVSMRSLCVEYFRKWFRQQYYFITPEPDARPGEEGVIKVTIEDLNLNRVVSVITARLVVAEPITPDDLSLVEKGRTVTLTRVGYDELGRSVFQLSVSSSSYEGGREIRRLIVEFCDFDNLLTFPAEVVNAHGLYQSAGSGSGICPFCGDCVKWEKRLVKEEGEVKEVEVCVAWEDAFSWTKSSSFSGYVNSPEQVKRLVYVAGPGLGYDSPTKKYVPPAEVGGEEREVWIYPEEITIELDVDFRGRYEEFSSVIGSEVCQEASPGAYSRWFGCPPDPTMDWGTEHKAYDTQRGYDLSCRIPTYRYVPPAEEEYHLFMGVSPNCFKVGEVKACKVRLSLLKTGPSEPSPLPVPGVKVRFELPVWGKYLKEFIKPNPLGRLIPSCPPEELEKILKGELEPTIVEEAVTDSQGEVHLLYLPPEQDRILDWLKRFGKLRIDITAKAEVEGKALQETETVTISSGPILEGVVMDVVPKIEGGEVKLDFPPLEGVEVRVVSPSGKIYWAETDSDGKFAVALVEDEEESGVYKLYKFYLSKGDLSPPKPIERPLTYEEMGEFLEMFFFPYTIARESRPELIRKLYGKLKELMPDFERALNELGFNYIETRWRDLRIRAIEWFPEYPVGLWASFVYEDKGWNDWNLLLRLWFLTDVLIELTDELKPLAETQVLKLKEALGTIVEWLKEVEEEIETLKGMSLEEFGKFIEREHGIKLDEDELRECYQSLLEDLQELKAYLEDTLGDLPSTTVVALVFCSPEERMWREEWRLRHEVMSMPPVEDIYRWRPERATPDDIELEAVRLAELSLFCKYAIPIAAFYRTLFEEGYKIELEAGEAPYSWEPKIEFFNRDDEEDLSWIWMNFLWMTDMISAEKADYLELGDIDPLYYLSDYGLRLGTLTCKLAPEEVYLAAIASWPPMKRLEELEENPFPLKVIVASGSSPAPSRFTGDATLRPKGVASLRFMGKATSKGDVADRLRLLLLKLEELKAYLEGEEHGKALTCIPEVLEAERELRKFLEEASLKADPEGRVKLEFALAGLIPNGIEFRLTSLRWVMGEASSEELSALLDRFISSLRELEDEVKGVKVEGKLPPVAALELEAVPSVRSGEAFKVEVLVENRGEEPGRFRIAASAEGPFVLLTRELDLGEIPPGGRKEAELELEALPVPEGGSREGKLAVWVYVPGGKGDSKALSLRLAGEAPWDVDGNGVVDIFDLTLVGRHFGESPPSDPRADVNGDGMVDLFDLVEVARHFGESPKPRPAPSPAVARVSLRAEETEEGVSLELLVSSPCPLLGFQLDLSYEGLELVSFELGDLLGEAYLREPELSPGRVIGLASVSIGGALPKAEGSLVRFNFKLKSREARFRVLRLKLADPTGRPIRAEHRPEFKLEELLVPRATALLQNYPNPFNGETWLPFKLGEEGEVVFEIYDLKGRLIRRLDLGRLGPGCYLSKGRAARWDGRDELGVEVASGVYFCKARLGSMTFVRKLILLK